MCSFKFESQKAKRDQRMRYEKFHTNKNCNGVIISERAYKQILVQMLEVCDESAINGVETGGILIGHIVDGLWYIVESIDQGINTTNEYNLFSYDNDYVNHLTKYIRSVYKYPLTILGIWHRHPGAMDYFSSTDENTMRENAVNSRLGIISMIVNVNPNIKMTFYFCSKDDVLMQVPYYVGDEYFIKDLLEYIDIKSILKHAGSGVGIVFPKGSSPDLFVHSMKEREERLKSIDEAVRNDKENDGYIISNEMLHDKSVSGCHESSNREIIAELIDCIVSSAHKSKKYQENTDNFLKLFVLALEELKRKGGNNNE